MPEKRNQCVQKQDQGTGRSRTQFWRISIVLAGILTILFVAYAPALKGPLLFDDYTLPYGLNTIRDLPLRVWVSGVRPALMFTYWLNYRLSEDQTFSYHLVNILLHMINGLLVWRILQRLFPTRPLLAMLGAGVFLAHPLQTESVAYIAGRSELLSGLFVLAAMLVFLAAKGRMRWLWALAIFALAGAGLLAKEQALVVAGCFLLLDSGWISAEPSLAAALRRNLRDHWRLYALFAVFGAAGSVLVFQVLQESRSAGFGLKNITWYQYFLAECRSIFLYLRLFFLPVGQSADHGVTVTRGALDVAGIAGLIALGALLRAAARYRRSAPLAGFGLLLFLLLLAPTSSFVPLADPVAEHRMYLPILGLIIIVLEAVSRLRISASALRASGMAVIGILVMATMARSQVWSGAAELAEDTVAKSPNAIRGYKMLSLAFMEENRCAQLVKALDAGPRDLLQKDASVLLGWAYGNECMGRLDLALDYFRRAAKVREDAFVEAEIGRVEARLGLATQSLASLNRSIRLQPEFDMAYCYRGYWHLAASDPVSARQDFQRALALNDRNRFAAAGLRQANGEAPVTSASEIRY